MKIVRDVEELDVLMLACDAAKTDDDLRAVLASFRMETGPDSGVDPFSSLYRDQQMDLYNKIAGRQYALTSEATPFDLEQAIRAPFPYSTGSCQTTGDHFVLMGEFLRHMRLPRGARVLEFGPGWGNLTLALAALGYQVTCVDIESRFCELIRCRAERQGLSLDVVNADFSWAGRVTNPFDAVIFFECFHHSADHLALLRDLHAAVRPGGRVYLGAEPILSDFPIPWGLRVDGQSLWSVRKFGWMELGFQDDYFRRALTATGWAGIRHPVSNPAIWELTSALMPMRFGLADAKIGTKTGQLVGSELTFNNAAAGEALFGPYCALPPGRFIARIEFRADQLPVGVAKMEVCALSANELLSSRRVEMTEINSDRPYLELPFSLETPREDIEVRLINDAGFSGCLTAIEIAEAS